MQALYSLGLYMLPWLAARFLSGEPPGLFLMGRIVFRHARLACFGLVGRSGVSLNGLHAYKGALCLLYARPGQPGLLGMGQWFRL